MDYRYQYDKAGNIVQRQTEEGIYQYGYDTLDRLTQAIPPTSFQQNETNPNGLPIEGYNYDAVHNRIASQHQPGSWNYNQNNQLLQWGTDNDKTSYTYNKLGHTGQETMIQNGITAKQRSYYYNAAERLTEVKENGTPIAQYHYDPFGRRISKTVNGETTHFQYSDEGLIAEYNQNGTIIKAYGWEPRRMWSTNPLWQAEPSGSQKSFYFYHNDHLGTSRKLTDKSGKISWVMQAEAFGNTTPKTDNTITNNLRFPGQYFDEETQTHYNYFRDYNPTTGRYLQSDPIGLNGGINIYAYVEGDPVDYSDSMGLRTPPQRSSPYSRSRSGDGQGGQGRGRGYGYGGYWYYKPKILPYTPSPRRIEGKNENDRGTSRIEPSDSGLDSAARNAPDLGEERKKWRWGWDWEGEPGQPHPSNSPAGYVYECGEDSSHCPAPDQCYKDGREKLPCYPRWVCNKIPVLQGW
jgi:RHS repeat-associated protein